jgi:hypothetical protein
MTLSFVRISTVEEPNSAAKNAPVQELYCDAMTIDPVFTTSGKITFPSRLPAS